MLGDGLAVVAGAAHAVAAGGIEAQWAAAATLLQGPTGVAAAGGHAVTAGAVIPQGARAHFREGLHRLLGQRRSKASRHDEAEANKPYPQKVPLVKHHDQPGGLDSALCSKAHQRSAEPCRLSIQRNVFKRCITNWQSQAGLCFYRTFEDLHGSSSKPKLAKSGANVWLMLRTLAFTKDKPSVPPMYTAGAQSLSRSSRPRSATNESTCFRKPQRITITVPWQLYQQLSLHCDLQGRSLSNLACFWLEQQAREESKLST